MCRLAAPFQKAATLRECLLLQLVGCCHSCVLSAQVKELLPYVLDMGGGTATAASACSRHIEIGRKASTSERR
jgi:hypothetical protein